MAVATVGAIALGEYPEAAAVMIFYQVGELFGDIAVARSRSSIAELMDIRPDYANIESGGEIKEVDPYDIEIGTDIMVRAGERIPIDGVVTDGSGTLDMSALTGESAPVEVTNGAEVSSGSINYSGVLRIRTTRRFEDSTASKILELMENSASKKAQSEKFISKFARLYTPAVCFAALALAVAVPVIRYILGMPPMWSSWIMRALMFLVISCPCALVISIPLSFFAAMGGAGRQGILIKGSNYIETMSKIRYAVFDKTGTVTYGTRDAANVAKPTAAQAISELKGLGIVKTVMLTGDKREAAEKIAAEVGIDELHSELMPADKVSMVEKLSEGGTLMFVGDGINDAPVLSCADIGAAMGVIGTDAAIEAADVVIMDDEPMKIPLAIRLSRRCMRIVYENIILTIGIKLLCLGLSAMGLVNMWMAIFADVGVMIIAVLNAIRCFRAIRTK